MSGRRRLLLPSLAAGVFLLSGCAAASATAGEDAAAPSSTPSAAPSSTPSAAPSAGTPGLPDVTTIVVRPEGLDLLADGAPVLALSYDDETARFVDGLTGALGSAPEVQQLTGGGTTYAWPGLLVADNVAGPGHSPMNVGVMFDAPVLGDGVHVTTVSGFAPGDDLAAYAEAHGERYWADGSGENLIPLETGPEQGPSTVDGRTNGNAVAGADWGPATVPPSTVFAPFNFGIEQGFAG